MKKTVIFLFLMITAIVFGGMTAFASPCCDISVKSVTQSDEAVVFNLSFNTVITPRDIRVDIRDSDNKRTASTVVTAEAGSGTIDASFNSAEFIKGETYTANIEFASECESGNCNGDITSFISTTGLEIIDYSGQKLELTAGEKLAVSLKTSVAGFYDFWYNCDIGYIALSKYGGGILSYGTNYYSAQEEFICVAEAKTDCEFTLYFEPSVISEENSLVTENVKDNDKLFSIEGQSGVKKIAIPVSGVYNFTAQTANEYESFRIMQDDMVTAYVYGDYKTYLEADTYYVITNDADEGSLLDIYYSVPGTIELDKSYNIADCVGNYYNLSLDRPTQLELTNGENVYIGITSLDYDFSLFLNDQTTVYPAGDYYLYVIENEEEVTGSFEILSTELEAVGMNEAKEPTFTDKNGMSYYAFCAPKTAEYVFDFSQSASTEALKCFYMSEYEYNDFVYKEMQAGEWIDISVEEGCMLKISEVGTPTYTSLVLDTPIEQICASGQRLYYSFTAEATESYRLSLGFDYLVRLYTENEILFSGRNDGDLTFDLEAGETVYIDLTVISVSDNNTDEIKISGRVISVEDGDTFNLNQNTSTEVNYISKEAGLYRVTVGKSGVTDSMSFYMNGDYIGYISGSSLSKSVEVYLKADENNIFEFDACGVNRSCTVTLTAVKLDSKSITEASETTVETGVYYEFITTESNVYLVTGVMDAEVKYGLIDSIVSSKGGYPVFSMDDERTALGAYSGEKYYLKFNYSGKITLSKAEAEKAILGTAYTAGNEFSVFKINADTAGYYRVDSERSNSELRILYDGGWNMIAGTYSNLFKLDAGDNFIIAIPKVTEYEECTTPSASFSIKKSESAKEYSVSIEEVSALPGMQASVKFLIQAPENHFVAYGYEYDADGVTQTVMCGNEAMCCSDLRRAEYNNAIEFEYGKAYTIRPFLIPEETGERVYGEEQTITVAMPKDIIKLTSKTTPVAFKAYGDYTYNWKEYTFSFVQPATEKVYITMPSFIEEYGIVDESYNNVYYYTDEGGNYYNLTEGTTYYIMGMSRVDGNSNITVSSLPENADVTIENATADIENNSISFTVSGEAVSGSLAYGAVYDSLGRILEIKAVAEPDGEETISFNNLKSASYCNILYVMQDSLKPLCENAYFEIGK